MTTVSIDLLRPATDGTPTGVPGALECTPTLRHAVDGDGIVLPVPMLVSLVDGVATVDLEPSTTAWVWRVIERVPGGSSTPRYLAVPDSVTPVPYADLVEVDPATLDPVGPPPADTWALALAAAADAAVQTVLQLDTDGVPYLTLEA